MPFVTDLFTSDDEVSGDKSVLTKKLVYQLTNLQNHFIAVPAGAVSDFASIPIPFRLLIPKMGRHRKAAVLHDYLYSKDNVYSYLTRKECDSIFSAAMKESGVPRWKSYSMYCGVRAGGWAYFRKKEMEMRIV